MRKSWLALGVIAGILSAGVARGDITSRHAYIAHETIAEALAKVQTEALILIDGTIVKFDGQNRVTLRDATGEQDVIVPLELLAGKTPYVGRKMTIVGHAYRAPFETLKVEAEMVSFDGEPLRAVGEETSVRALATPDVAHPEAKATDEKKE